MLGRAGAPLVAAALAMLGCVPALPTQAPRAWPAHDGIRCVEVPTAQCQEMAAQAEMPGAPAARPIRGVTVVCSRPAGCDIEAGAGDAFVHHADGSSSSFGWGYGTADGPAPAAPPGIDQPRSPAEIDCVRLPQTVCDERVDDVYLDIPPGAPQPMEIQVACGPGVTCTEGNAGGTTTVLYPDGTLRSSSWSVMSAGEPPPTP